MRDRYDIALGHNPTLFAWPACDFDFPGECNPRDIDCSKECPRVKEIRIEELMSTEDGRAAFLAQRKKLAESMVRPVKHDIDYDEYGRQVPLSVGVAHRARRLELQSTPSISPNPFAPFAMGGVVHQTSGVQFFDVSLVKDPTDPSCRVISMDGEPNPYLHEFPEIVYPQP